MRSTIYTGFVEHVRLKPVQHRLRYPLYFYAIDVDELPEMDRRLPLFGYNRWRPIALFDADYLDGQPAPIRHKLDRFLAENGLSQAIARVVLITQPRYFGAVFNPVSFYYCYAAEGALACVVTEVNNTFGERHIYLLKDADRSLPGYPAVFTTDKAFHVSPFNDISGAYELSFSDIGPEIDIHVDLIKNREKVFGAQLWGKSASVATHAQLALILRHPFIPRLTITRIYWQAAKLFFLKHLAYHPKPLALNPMTIRHAPPPSITERMCLRIIDRLLANIQTGGLDLALPDGSLRVYGHKPTTLRPRIMVNEYQFFSRMVAHGEVGLGEAYTEGLWDSDDLTGALGLLIENREALAEGNLPLSALSRFRNFRLHLSRANTLTGSRGNIAAHYDLSADFYQTFLDGTMTYSCGLFRHADESLEQAQHNKIQAVIAKARITEHDHVLEIGCGWGGFAIEAVRTTNCRITGITISRAQYDYTRALVRRLGLEDRIEILLEDYRTVQGAYDKIVSIEMIEAVGHENLGTFFECCDRLLKPDGLAVLQAITIPDARYDRHRGEPNWIQKHIFPGGVLPSLTALCTAMTQMSTLVVEDLENIGNHYAETLNHWRQNFIQAGPELTRMGFDRNFQRTWIYYFSICEAQFERRVLNDLQLVLTREGNKCLAGIGHRDGAPTRCQDTARHTAKTGDMR